MIKWAICPESDGDAQMKIFQWDKRMEPRILLLALGSLLLTLLGIGGYHLLRQRANASRQVQNTLNAAQTRKADGSKFTSPANSEGR